MWNRLKIKVYTGLFKFKFIVSESNKSSAFQLPSNSSSIGKNDRNIQITVNHCCWRTSYMT